MFNRLSRIILLSILLLSFSLTACHPETISSPTSSQTQTTSGESISPTLTATSSPSQTPTAALPPTATPTTMPSPTATQPWAETSFERTPLPELAGQITVDNMGSVIPLAIWGNGSANGISISPDGQVLAVMTNLGAVFYDSISYVQLALVPTSLPVKAITFSKDNLQVALGLSDGSIEIIERGYYSSLIRLENLTSTLEGVIRYTLSFSPDSKELFQVIEASKSIQVRRWQTGSWKMITNFSLNSGWTTFVSTSLDLLYIIANEDLALQSLKYTEDNDLLDLPSSIAPSFWTRMASEGGEVAVSSDGDFILISNGVAIALWELLSDEYTYLLDDYPGRIPDPCSQAPDTCLNASGGFSWACDDSTTMDPIERIALTPDNIMVLISRNDNLTEFRRVSDSLMLWEIEATFTDVAFSPGGEFFFGLRPDGTIEKRATLDGAMIDFLNLHSGQLFSMAFSTDGGTLATGFSDGLIRVFSTGNGEMLGVLTGTARSLQFSSDGALLAAGLDDGTVRIFILDEGRFYDIAPGHLAAVTDLVFSTSGELLLTGSADCTTSLWNVSERKRVQTRIPSDETPFRVYQVVLGWDEQTEFIAGNRTGITSFSGLSAETSLLPEITIQDLALSPDGMNLAAAGEGLFLISLIEDEAAHLTQLDAGQVITSFATTFDITGNLLADVTSKEIRFWSVDDATLLNTLQIAAYVSAENPPIAVSFSPTGDLVALATADGFIQIFGIPIGTGN
jgi:WD40 repeat protein